ncbi:OTU domain-containing protein DDB_G0284757-like isoform X3 [Olea europaea var. sylvestris]|uniref:OTU domain-containing protein DDB_G0284757-like isoform X3 n=1 Tax=Olea europaea var. sylvestris TaxID=158386 RepID=UPI000C1D87C9|nr:OTU domain-containing protein DDB_G0284757-like isoform X3 [Olea europaea var. sylvestris]
MTTHQFDPDIVRWGHHLIDCSPMRGGSPKIITCYDMDMSRIYYVEEGYCDTTESVVENDEVIAHALQEELARLRTTEESRFTCAEDQDQQESVFSQDWSDTSRRQFYYDYNSNQESTLDSELGRRLNEMIPVPHVPKINGEIPSADDAMSDHERMLARLELYDLVEREISGDGNCQFRSLSDQIYRTPKHHKLVREQVLYQLMSYRELYENYVPMAYDDYLKKMSKTGEWGDHVTLQAAADTYGVKIFVITSFRDTCYIEILPNTLKSNRMIFLSFWAEVHYNSIYPREEYLRGGNADEGKGSFTSKRRERVSLVESESKGTSYMEYSEEFPVLGSKKKKKWWKA